MVSSIALYAWRSVTTTMLSEPWIFDAAIFVTLRSISVVILSPVPLHCQSCLAWQPSGARDKVSKFTIYICNNHEPLDFQLNKEVRTIAQKSSMMASGSLEMLSLQGECHVVYVINIICFFLHLMLRFVKPATKEWFLF